MFSTQKIYGQTHSQKLFRRKDFVFKPPESILCLFGNAKRFGKYFGFAVGETFELECTINSLCLFQSDSRVGCGKVQQRQ